jgi:hypothetical protein
MDQVRYQDKVLYIHYYCYMSNNALVSYSQEAKELFIISLSEIGMFDREKRIEF